MAYSIEELFHTIAGELGKFVEVVGYAVEDRGSFFLDAWRLRKLNAGRAQKPSATFLGENVAWEKTTSS